MSNFIDNPGQSNTTIRLKALPKQRLVQLMNEKGISATEAVSYLLEFYYADDLSTLRSLRYRLKKRIRKGINYVYVQELKKLQELLNSTLKLL